MSVKEEAPRPTIQDLVSSWAHISKDEQNAMDFINAFTKLNYVIGLLGKAFIFVYRDIEQKLVFVQTKDNGRGKTLQQIMTEELESNMIQDKSSASRNILRLYRALNFICLFLTMLDTGEKELRECANTAYDQSLRQHHIFAVRSLVKVALYTLPYRENFLLNLNLDPKQKNQFQELVVYIRSVKDNLGSFF